MSDHLPVEVMVEILKRLPAKSVVKCMSVCKSWNILIKTPSFISTHLQTSLSKPCSDLFLVYNGGRADRQTFSFHFDNNDFDEFKQLPSPVEGGVLAVGSCNGLVCLCLNSFQDILNLILWNPSIQKHITLPKPNITKNDFYIFGFGFDSRTNDHKLLVALNESGETSKEAYLFSLNENSWKRVTAIPLEYYKILSILSIFVNGAFHWVGYKREQDGSFGNMILGFDISNEQFFVIRLPENLISMGDEDLSIMKYKESSIAMLRKVWEDNEIMQVELWVMKTYGVVGSWTKVLHFTDQSGSGKLLTFLGFRKNGEVLLRLIDGELTSLDLNRHRMKHLAIQAKYGFSYVDSYVESLVLLEKGMDAGDSSGK